MTAVSALLYELVEEPGRRLVLRALGTRPADRPRYGGRAPGARLGVRVGDAAAGVRPDRGLGRGARVRPPGPAHDRRVAPRRRLAVRPHRHRARGRAARARRRRRGRAARAHPRPLDDRQRRRPPCAPVAARLRGRRAGPFERRAEDVGGRADGRALPRPTRDLRRRAHAARGGARPGDARPQRPAVRGGAPGRADRRDAVAAPRPWRRRWCSRSASRRSPSAAGGRRFRTAASIALACGAGFLLAELHALAWAPVIVVVELLAVAVAALSRAAPGRGPGPAAKEGRAAEAARPRRDAGRATRP